MPPPPHIPLAILGLGPTGLGAAYRLLELGQSNFHAFDANPYLGGLAASFTDHQGFTWDIGGHVMFSHYDYYDRVFDRLMGSDFSMIDRSSYVRSHDAWVPYPFQNNIRHLPKQVAFECLAGLVKAQAGRGKVPSAAAAKNFAEFIDAVFGEGLATHFMRPYNFKVWAHPPETMNKEWIGERVAVIDVERALRNVLLEQDDAGWGPNNRFKFPLRGGTGEFYRRFGPIIAEHASLNTRIARVNIDTRTLTLADGRRHSFEALLSTMPVDRLVADVLEGNVPTRIRDLAARLLHSAGHFVGIGLKRPVPRNWSWMYFPDANSPFYRVTYLSNYSPHMTPDRARHYSLLCETSESRFKPVNAATIVEDTIRGLEASDLLQPGERDDIVSVWHHRVEYSYPTPSVERDGILAELIPWLESRGIYSRGRFGMWKYEVANTDHSLMQGVEWVNRMTSGEPETTIGLKYRVTESGREAAEHHRPTVAGSGEKRLIAIEPKPLRTSPISLAPIGEEELGVTGKTT